MRAIILVMNVQFTLYLNTRSEMGRIRVDKCYVFANYTGVGLSINYVNPKWAIVTPSSPCKTFNQSFD